MPTEQHDAEERTVMRTCSNTPILDLTSSSALRWRSCTFAEVMWRRKSAVVWLSSMWECTTCFAADSGNLQCQSQGLKQKSRAVCPSTVHSLLLEEHPQAKHILQQDLKEAGIICCDIAR